MSPTDKGTRRVPTMLRYTILALLVYVAGRLVAFQAPNSIFTLLSDLGLLALTVPAAYYAIRAFRWLRGHLLWKVRNRIIASYILVGLLPLILISLVGWLSMVVIFKQLTALYVAAELEAIRSTLNQTCTRIIMQFAGREQDDLLQALQREAAEQIKTLPAAWGPARFDILEEWPGEDAEGTSPLRRLAPKWLNTGFDGFTQEGQQLSISTVKVFRLEQGNFLLRLSLPFNERVMDDISRRTSMQLQLTRSDTGFADRLATFARRQDRLAVSAAHFFTPVQWISGEPAQQMSILVWVPIPTLINQFFSQGGTVLGLLTGLVTLFLVVEIVALIMAATMARSITRSVANIYRATDRIQSGDFAVRIPTGDRGQLDAMAASFNRMAASIQRLMGEVSAKEALAKDVEVATLVQHQLFPQQLPSLEGVQIAAVCIPARQVSGDYYDFIAHGDKCLDIIFGDISGKGISAALTMASIQSSIRSQLLNHSPGTPNRLASSLSRISRRLYQQSRPETFSTVVLAELDPRSLLLDYTNGGHNPPLIFSNGEVRRLEKGGTVAGLVQMWDYEQGREQLSAGDVLLFYTDGVSEAANEGDEEFGEERLIELVRTNTFLTAADIQQLLVDEVFAFCGKAEQADDITVVCVKIE